MALYFVMVRQSTSCWKFLLISVSRAKQYIRVTNISTVVKLSGPGIGIV